MYRQNYQLGVPSPRNVDQYQVVELQNAEHKQQLISSNRIVCVDIYADWCGPCKHIAPDYGSLAGEKASPGNCQLVKEKLDLGLTQGITSVPTFQFFRDGQLVTQVRGANLDKVREILEKLTADIIPSTNPQDFQGPQYQKSTIRQSRHVGIGTGDPDSLSSGQPYQGDTGAKYHTYN